MNIVREIKLCLAENVRRVCKVQYSALTWYSQYLHCSYLGLRTAQDHTDKGIGK